MEQQAYMARNNPYTYPVDRTVETTLLGFPATVEIFDDFIQSVSITIGKQSHEVNPDELSTYDYARIMEIL